jgi:ribonuclease-3
MNAAEAVFRTLGYEFKNVDLITEALTHRSYSHEKKISYNNERLEFLGDTVLDLIMSQLLCEIFKDADEGTLSALRSQFVSESTLAEFAEKIGMGAWLLLGKGEERMGGRKRLSTLADTFEAILGAMYLDGGLEVCHAFLKGLFAEKIEKLRVEVQGRGRPRDPKSYLQEICQQAWGLAPTYECVSESRKGSQRVFEMSLRIKNVELVRSRAASKKEATLLAAQDLLKRSEGKIESIEGLMAQSKENPGEL